MSIIWGNKFYPAVPMVIIVVKKRGAALYKGIVKYRLEICKNRSRQKA